MFTIAQLSLYETLREWCDSNDFDPFQQNDRGENLLTIAAVTNCIPLCATLIAKVVNVNECGVNGRYGSALAAAVAAAWDRLDTVKYLVEEVKPDVSLQIHVKTHGSVLATAAFSGKLDIVRYLVEEANFDVNLQLGEETFGSVLAAAARGSLVAVKYLVEEAKADVNVPHQAGNALVAAVLSGNRDMVRYFVEEAKADVYILVEGWLLDMALEDYDNEDAVALREILKLPSEQEEAGDGH
ncbi:hypothetical protein N7471_011288 [Penicillium samsonianum]|uniref:uncharacterized protein n=1 Tax=Penicillium samsonianum TaxID=1882272 RepID=UPI0025478317|nr:uncharacterized protein N7471_011288 [Penicillium samsonianum]KAJ6123971.1 hypothetical protein N7471_011288 [Penicillium samsonianum]